MPQSKATKSSAKPKIRYESVKIEPLFAMLDAVAWIDHPSTKHIAQFANVDPRTAGKILKNARLMGLVDTPDDANYVLTQPYPYKGSPEEKKRVVREAMLRLPLVRSIRQFLSFGDGL